MDLQFLADGSPPRVLECVQTSTVCRGIHRIYICTFVHLEYLYNIILALFIYRRSNIKKWQYKMY